MKSRILKQEISLDFPDGLKVIKMSLEKGGRTSETGNGLQLMEAAKVGEMHLEMERRAINQRI